MRPFSALCLGALALAVGGCAKFPSNDRGNEFTRLSFRINFSGEVDTTPNKYIYAVAIRPLTLTQYTANDNRGPIPVTTTGSREGIVAGRPTRLVLYTPGVGQYQYQVYRYPNLPSDLSDPDPGTSVLAGDVLSGVDPRTSGFPNTLAFDITTQDLIDNRNDVEAARNIYAIEFNILTMNQAAISSGGLNNRVIDALGSQRTATDFNAYRRVLIQTSATYNNSNSAIREPENDLYPVGSTLPAIDITDYSLDVRPQ